VRLLYDLHKKRSTRPSFDEFYQDLYSVGAAYSRVSVVIVVIDALDKCQRFDKCRSRCIPELLNLGSALEANIFATSRFIPEITSRFDNAVVKEIRASDYDIARDLDGNLSGPLGLVSRDITLQAKIKQRIVQCIDGMLVRPLIQTL
jgi:hypothetical protein